MLRPAPPLAPRISRSTTSRPRSSTWALRLGRQRVVVSDTVVSTHNGVTHVYLQQQHKGIGVYNGLINVNVARDGSVISAGNRFVSNLAAATAGTKREEGRGRRGRRQQPDT